MRGLEIKEILQRRGISQAKMSRDLNIDYCALNMALNEKGPFFPKYKRLIADYLELPVPDEVIKKEYAERKDTVLHVLIPYFMMELIEDIAKAEGISKSEVIRTALKEGLGI